MPMVKFLESEFKVPSRTSFCRSVSICPLHIQGVTGAKLPAIICCRSADNADSIVLEQLCFVEEWNTIAEGGPDFYTTHLPLPPEPQPSIASMQQGGTAHLRAMVYADNMAACVGVEHICLPLWV